MGDDLLSVDEVLASVELGRELTVARRRRKVWIDVILPDPAASPKAAPKAP